MLNTKSTLPPTTTSTTDQNFYPSFSYTNQIHSIYNFQHTAECSHSVDDDDDDGTNLTDYKTEARKQFFVLWPKENSWNRSRSCRWLPFNSFMCDVPSLSPSPRWKFPFQFCLPFTPLRTIYSRRDYGGLWTWHSLRVCAFNIMTPRHYLKVWISWYGNEWRCAATE